MGSRNTNFRNTHEYHCSLLGDGQSDGTPGMKIVASIGLKDSTDARESVKQEGEKGTQRAVLRRSNISGRQKRRQSNTQFKYLDEPDSSDVLGVVTVENIQSFAENRRWSTGGQGWQGQSSDYSYCLIL